MFKRYHPYPLWGLLSLFPAFWAYQAATSSNERILHILVHPSGEWAARLLILTLAITPLAMIFRGSDVTRWLKKNRRYFGVAAFAYAAVHSAFYLADKASLDRVVSELPRLYIWTGWLAFLIFIPLAATSADWAMRRLGPQWKSLQRWTYAAAVLTLVHWASLHDWGHPLVAVLHFAPLAALEGWRMWYWWNRHRPATA
ncbi:ferric reductase-like transmembrane domain-containing protein [Sedimentitalea sp. JM2-8]|uniref:Ferric reductase-like transmembrane domain-containing protein n=1 Tax=Sedimentitalea xiamensis TaxID=3050037 RepID=A0ABT7FHL6_9RHOB|nr:ferric reductase-like transmembrane domain-containing protein [Sedimentitalea xiamensis]MDK3074603.1 ferric reductase-like transmembrane domain-containing protein [Sedimentitalea xiamensis]